MARVGTPAAKAGRSPPASPVLYERIADDLAREIRSRRLPPFARLPSESALMARFGVSRVTVRQALRKLADAGLVISRQGKGVFVAGVVVNQELSSLRGFYDSLVAQGHHPVATVVDFERQRPAVASPELRQFATDIYRFRRLYRLGDMPIALAEVALPGAGRTVTREDVERFPVYALLSNVIGREVARASVQVRAAKARPGVAALLNLAKGATVLVMERTSFDAEGLALETSTFFIPPEVYAFQMEVAGPLKIASSLKRVEPPENAAAVPSDPRTPNRSPKSRSPGGKSR